MLKILVAATAAFTIAGSMLAYAQPGDGNRDGARRSQPNVEDIRAFQAARLAALRAGLMLNAEQEKHWPAFEAAMRDLQQLRLSRMGKAWEMRRERRENRGENREAREGRENRGEYRGDYRQGREGPKNRGENRRDREGREEPAAVNPAERMLQRATRLSENGAVLKRLADALDPLYRSLDDAQKRRFAILSRVGGPRGGLQRRGRDGGEPGMERRQRRSEAAPIEAVPQDETLFSRRRIDETSIDEAPLDLIFGGKLTIEEAAIFASNTIGGEPALFGGKASPFGGKFTTGEGPSFSRKINIEEPSVFGRKALQSI